VFLKALAPYRLSPSWTWRGGETALLRRQIPMNYDGNRSVLEPGLAAELEARLDRWLAEQVDAWRSRAGVGLAA
jgi:hypothetical protein